jgi:hypothetical protein
MANYRRKSKWKSILCGILVVATLIGACAGIAALGKKETKTIGAGAFKVGGVNENGIYEKSTVSIYTEDMFECQGLVIEPEFEASGTYRVFYYDSNKNFIGATEVMNAADSIYTKGNSFILAKYARIMITPDAVDEDGKADKDFKIRFYEVYGYASDFTITVNKKQEEPEVLYYGENKFVNHVKSTASLAGGVDGFEISAGNTDISELVDITDCTNICIKVKKADMKYIELYFHKQSEYHTSTSLNNFPFEATEDGDFVYLVMTLSAAYADDVAINLVADEGIDMTGTEIYVW